ncbi:MAG TPA: alkene reductase [Albidovulum sp.]|uniref:alkene reductase n=1 Tax=Albidovulum sp. TaxID=1872424 RepID=UPI002C8B8923|nr:alkene reductase [Albidovulum sp.]
MTSLWDPIRIGRLNLGNRLVMAPMTRNRALPDGTPADIAATYYAQRASFGLIVTEGTQPSADGQGYMLTPGLHADEHVAGWRKVTEAVHDAGGHIFIQLMHTGRRAHPDNTPHHRQPVAPSAFAANDMMGTPNGQQPTPEPRALTTAEVRQTVRDFADAARRAVEAGADGVEIHGANGYLIQQFFAPNANTRTDAYGGSLENRARFAIEIAKAIVAEIGADRTGIRLSPLGTGGGLDEGPEAKALYLHLIGELDKLDLAYLHILHHGDEDFLKSIRATWHRPLIVNRWGAVPEALDRDLRAGTADAVAVGKLALVNPDLVARLKAGAPLNTPRPESFFGGTEVGYTDYASLKDAAALPA